MRHRKTPYRLNAVTEIDAGTFVLKGLKLAKADKADAPEGTIWECVILATGVSKTNPPIYFSQEVLDRSASVFEGAKIYANEGGPHVESDRKTVKDEVGWLFDVKSEPGKLVGKIHLLPSAEWLRQNLLTKWKNGAKLYELSIDAAGNTYLGQVGNATMLIAEGIDHVNSVDIVPAGALGGTFTKLVQSKHTSSGGTIMKQLLTTLFLLSFPGYLVEKAVDLTKVDENELYTHLYQANKAQPRFQLPEGFADVKEAEIKTHIETMKQAASKSQATDIEKIVQSLQTTFQQSMEQTLNSVKQLLQTKKAEGDPAPETEAEKRLKQMEIRLAEADLTNRLLSSNLPEDFQDELREQFKGRVFQMADLDQAIEKKRKIAAKLTQSVPDFGGNQVVEPGLDEKEKFRLAMHHLFLTAGQRIKPVVAGTDEYKSLFKGVSGIRSIRQAYVMFTGDELVTGRPSQRTRFTQSLSTSDWAEILQDSMNKAMVRDYGALNLDTWRAFVDVVPVNDFKTQHRIRRGGYPNLSVVPERDPYPALTSPGDEEATYAAKKRGGTEDVTREMIKNDDLSEIQRIPRDMARAAAQTLHEFVYDFIRPGVNPTIYDAKALYHNDHGNTATTALGTDGAALAAARLRLMKQTRLGNNKRLGLRLRYLAVPPDLEKLADELTRPAFGANNDTPTFLQTKRIVPIVVEYWTDATDWVAIADKADVVGLELGFIDGQETPMMFVADLPNAGSFFTHDVLTYKIRHEYDGAVIDYRAFDGSIVAG